MPIKRSKGPDDTIELTLKMAQAAATIATDQAHQLGFAVSATVVDESGRLATAHRWDGARFTSPDTALAKAVAAATFKSATITLAENRENASAFWQRVVPVLSGDELVVGRRERAADHDDDGANGCEVDAERFAVDRVVADGGPAGRLRQGWLVTPDTDTLLRWHRRRVARHWTQPARPPGRPPRPRPNSTDWRSARRWRNRTAAPPPNPGREISSLQRPH